MLRKKVIIYLILLLQSSSLFAQKENNNSYVDSIARHVPDSLTYSTKSLAKFINSYFINDNEKLRAYYTWITHNIQYDFEDSRELIYDDELENYVHETLVTRKGKCQGFAELFHELCLISGIKSFVVSGLVKRDEKKGLETHAWNAALDSEQWKLFDITYGAGYEINNTYIQEFDDKYFDICPSQLIETHYPFDPIWQLSEYPVNFLGFIDPESQKYESQLYFNYGDSITFFLSLNKYEQLNSARPRIIEFKNHAHNEQIEHWLENIDQQIVLLTYNEMITFYNQCIKEFNEVSNSFGKWLRNKNTGSLSLNTSEEDITFLDQLIQRLASSKNLLRSLVADEEKLVFNIILLKHEITRLHSKISEYKTKLHD